MRVMAALALAGRPSRLQGSLTDISSLQDLEMVCACVCRCVCACVCVCMYTITCTGVESLRGMPDGVMFKTVSSVEDRVTAGFFYISFRLKGDWKSSEGHNAGR